MIERGFAVAEASTPSAAQRVRSSSLVSRRSSFVSHKFLKRFPWNALSGEFIMNGYE